MKKFVLVAILAIISLGTRAQITGVLHYLPTMSDFQAKSYAHYDMITVDPEVIFNSPDALKLLRRENPSIKIFLYVNITEWYVPMFPDKPWSIYILKELEKHEGWWLHGTDRKRIEFWHGTNTMNLSINGFKVKIGGKKVTYVEYITEHLIKDVIDEFKRQGIRLDGAHFDQVLPKPFDWLGHYGINHSGLDANGDGKEDQAGSANIAWRLGMQYCMEKVRDSQGQDFVIIANGGNGFFLKSNSGKVLCNGKQFEDFPDKYLDEGDAQTGGWLTNMNNASNLDLVMFNARKDNWLFTIASAMLLDNVIFAYIQNSPYEDKFNLHLGDAKGKFTQAGPTYLREYQNGIVYVNPFEKKAWIKYNSGKVLKD